MTFTPQFGSRTAESGPGKRQSPRHVQHTLTSNLGPVLDLSPAGMRVKCRRVPDGRTRIMLNNHVLPGELYGEVAWSRPSGNFHHEVGLRFENVSGEMAGRLKRIAMDHRFRRAI